MTARRSFQRERNFPDNMSYRIIARNCAITFDPRYCLDVRVEKFAGGETRVLLCESVRELETVYIVASFGAHNVNDALMELVLIANALKTSGAKDIRLIISCYGYARQDRSKFGSERAPVSSSVVASILEQSLLQISSIFVVDIHCLQIQNAFRSARFANLSVAPVTARRVALDLIQRYDLNEINVTVVSPDHGATARNKEFQSFLNPLIPEQSNMAVIDKSRAQAGVVSDMILTTRDPIEGRIAIITDDIADSCGTLCMAAEILHQNGAVAIYAVITHGIFSGRAIDRINASKLDRLYVTNTLVLSEEALSCPKIHIVDIGNLVGSVIDRDFNKKSISALYGPRTEILFHENTVPIFVEPSLYSEVSIVFEPFLYYVSDLIRRGFRIGALTHNKTKLNCLPLGVIPAISNDYVPDIEQPWNYQQLVKACSQRFSVQTGGPYDMVISIESGLLRTGNQFRENTLVMIQVGGTLYQMDLHRRNPWAIPSDCVDFFDKADTGITFGSHYEALHNMNNGTWHECIVPATSRGYLITKAIKQKTPTGVTNYAEKLVRVKAHKGLIQYYQDFPQKGIKFANLYPILHSRLAMADITDLIHQFCKMNQINKVLSLSSRGYLIGCPAATIAGLDHITISKPGKLPEDIVDIQSYDKEYGSDSLQLMKGQLSPVGTLHKNFLIVDDVLATGGSMWAAMSLVKKQVSDANIHIMTLTHVEDLYQSAIEKLSDATTINVLM